MPNLFRNNAASTLAVQAQLSDTSLQVATGTGNRFPTLASGEFFYATVQAGVDYEIVKCTARAGDILTVDRAQDGTTARLWSVGTPIDMRIPRITLENFLQKNEVALLAAGTAAAPSVSFSGDPDTGALNSGANQYAIATGGAIRFLVDASSYVGINTLAPVRQLEVSSPNNHMRFSTPGDATAYYDFGRDNTDGLFFFNGAQPTFVGYKWLVNGGRVLTISDGNTTLDANTAGDVSLFLRNNTASGAVTRGAVLAVLNESSVPVAAINTLIQSDGGSQVYIEATPAGSRVSDRRVTRMVISGSDPITLVGPVNVSSGDLNIAENLRFNSGYGSAALAFGVRAWANFDGVNLVNSNGTYSQSGTTVTVNLTNHGLLAGQFLYADITSGTGVDGIYTVASVIDANTFTYTAGTSLTTSGNISLPRCTVRGAGNVGSVVRIATGDYVVNFAAPMSDANYMATASVSATSVGADANVAMMWGAGRNSHFCRFGCSNNNSDLLVNSPQVDFMVVR